MNRKDKLASPNWEADLRSFISASPLHLKCTSEIFSDKGLAWSLTEREIRDFDNKQSRQYRLYLSSLPKDQSLWSSLDHQNVVDFKRRLEIQRNAFLSLLPIENKEDVSCLKPTWYGAHYIDRTPPKKKSKHVTSSPKGPPRDASRCKHIALSRRLAAKDRLNKEIKQSRTDKGTI